MKGSLEVLYKEIKLAIFGSVAFSAHSLILLIPSEYRKIHPSRNLSVNFYTDCITSAFHFHFISSNRNYCICVCKSFVLSELKSILIRQNCTACCWFSVIGRELSGDPMCQISQKSWWSTSFTNKERVDACQLDRKDRFIRILTQHESMSLETLQKRKRFDAFGVQQWGFICGTLWNVFLRALIQ